jgi:lipopolysaccharide/colanic/teichoic acid biosynthesis glycosyltransferase
MQETKPNQKGGLYHRGSSIFQGKNYQKLKRSIDVVFAISLTLIFSPLMLLIALGVKLHSPGPILYRQKRIGRDGSPFFMLKFRSMRVNSDKHSHHKDHVQRLIKDNLRPEDIGAESLKLKTDPRITGLGKVLRKLSLDELPQFLNVVRGEMSLVGPRPPLPYEFELYEDWHKERLAVLPGITGLWQVTARNRVSFDEMVHIDMSYIQQMSPWLDLIIIVRTPIEMVRGIGGG